MSLRKCTACGITANTVEDLSLFSTNKRGLYGKENKCKKCKSVSFAKWRDKNPSYRKQYYTDNYYAERKAGKKWQQNNKAKVLAATRKYQAAKKNATPSWADLDIIEDFYKEAEYFQAEIDHIVPLQSKEVCGLHVEHNLQLLSSAANKSKSNKLDWKRTA